MRAVQVDVRGVRRSALILAIVCGLAAVDAVAQSQWQIGAFVRPAEGNPVIEPRPASIFDDPILGKPVHWEALHTFNPAAVVRGGKIFVLYRAEDDTGSNEIGGHTSRLGLAESEDGIHFNRSATPVFFPAKDSQKEREWPGGVEDPRIVESEDGSYVLTYTQWNRVTYSVGIATSKDLIHWRKFGPAFLDASGGKYADSEVQVGGNCDTPEGWTARCGTYPRAVLDVLGGRRNSSRDITGFDSLDPGGRLYRIATGRARQAKWTI